MTAAKAGLLRADVERRTLARWRPGDPTWMTTTKVAAVLGVTGPRVSQLARRGFRVGQQYHPWRSGTELRRSAIRISNPGR